MPNQQRPEVRFSALSPARRQLVRILQQLGHGHIDGLVVRRGEPVYDPLPTLVSDRPDAPPRPELRLADFTLKASVLDLLATLDDLGDGVVARIDVRAGLPTRVLLAGQPPEPPAQPTGGGPIEGTQPAATDLAATLEAARDLIRLKARALARRPGFRPQDQDDLAQALVGHLLARMGAFDPAKAPLEAFVCRVLAQGAANLLRDRYAQKRHDPTGVSLDQIVADAEEGPHPLADDVEPRHRDARLGTAGRDDHDRADLAADVAAFLETLTGPERRAVDAVVTHGSVAAAARALGVGRAVLAATLARVRARAARLGLADYFQKPPPPRQRPG